MSFKEYLKESLNNDVIISDKTLKWLKDWQWAKDITEIPSDVEQELKQFVPNKPIDLYRFIERKDIVNEPKKKLKSYTTNPNMALEIIESFEPMRGFVDVWYQVPPEKIVVMFDMIPKKYKKK